MVLSVISPTWSNITNIRLDIAEKTAARDELQEVIAKAREVLSRQADVERTARPIYASLPVSPSLPELVAILSSISFKDNVALTQVRFEETPQPSGTEAATASPAASIKITANIVGKYPDIKTWLKDIESELRLIDVLTAELQIISGEKSPTADTPVNAALTLLAYWQPQVTTFK